MFVNFNPADVLPKSKTFFCILFIINCYDWPTHAKRLSASSLELLNNSRNKWINWSNSARKISLCKIQGTFNWITLIYRANKSCGTLIIKPFLSLLISLEARLRSLLSCNSRSLSFLTSLWVATFCLNNSNLSAFSFANS